MSESTSNAEITDLISELEWRGLIKDCTDKDALRDHLRTPKRKIYAGFDPTADSLTIGNLVPIMMLAHVKRAGHTPVVIMGGGTGLIGDPSGKSAERQMMTKETVEHHVNCQRPIFENVLGQIDGPEHLIKNNLDWLGGISYIEALRDIGKHFSVNMMMQKESVKERLNNREQGISYTEFSYMILQAYDFAYLYEQDVVTVQFGGSDQYGNILAGADLIRRTNHVEMSDHDKHFWREYSLGIDEAIREQNHGKRKFFEEKREEIDRKYILSHGLTAPLVSKADGGKFGKTESGAVWLTAARTSPYAYYQFWLNASDEDARNWVKVFTFLPQDEVEALIARHDEAPGKRELQRTLAQQATQILHGTAAMENAEAAGKALFSGEIASLDKDTLVEVFASVPTTEHSKSELAGDGVDPMELLKSCDLASSNREAREFLGSGSVSINGEKIDADTRISTAHLLHGSFIAIRRGKKNWHMTKWS
jgi:tyrosyl-tRNA synthetase